MTDPYDGVPFDPVDPGEPASHEEQVARAVAKLRITDEARALYAREKSGPLAPFDAGTLAEILARPDAATWRVENLIPADAATLIVAQRKTGKTTLGLNLARSLLTGEPFLGTFDVKPIAGSAAVLNFEVSGATLARWASDAGVPPDRLFVVNLRGQRNPFADPVDSARLAALLRERDVEALIVDPFGRAYPGASQNDAGEVGAWLASLDTFTRGDVGATDLLLAAHAGWNGERTRGSSALEDWADVTITLTRGGAEDDPARYLRAEGRDVQLDEDQLAFDATTRTLTLAGTGSRATAARTRHITELVAAVTDIVAGRPGINGREVDATLRETGVPHQKGDHAKALAQAVEQGLLSVAPGPRNAKCYTALPTYPDVPRATPRGTSPPTPTVPIGDGVGERGMSEPHPPQRQPELDPTNGSTCSDCGEPLTAQGATTRCRPKHQQAAA